jgi:predicted transcriptional regulator
LDAKGTDKVKMTSLHDILAGQSSGKGLLDSVDAQEVRVVKDSDSLLDAYNLLVSGGTDTIAVSRQGVITGKISYKDIARTYHDHIHLK